MFRLTTALVSSRRPYFSQLWLLPSFPPEENDYSLEGEGVPHCLGLQVLVITYSPSPQSQTLSITLKEALFSVGSPTHS